MLKYNLLTNYKDCNHDERTVGEENMLNKSIDGKETYGSKRMRYSGRDQVSKYFTFGDHVYGNKLEKHFTSKCGAGFFHHNL